MVKKNQIIEIFHNFQFSCKLLKYIFLSKLFVKNFVFKNIYTLENILFLIKNVLHHKINFFILQHLYPK